MLPWVFLVFLHLWSLRAGHAYAVVMPPPAAAPSLQLPADLRVSLQSNADALKPQVMVQWDRTRTSTIPLARYRKDHEPISPFEAELNLRGTDHITFWWQADNQYREEWIWEGIHPKTHQLTTRFNFAYTFNGENYFEHGRNPDEDHSLTITTKAEMDATGEDYEQATIRVGYFHCCGLKLPVRHQEIAQNLSPTSAIVDLLAAGAKLKSIGKVVNNDVPLTRLELLLTNDFTAGNATFVTTMDVVSDRTLQATSIIFDVDPALHDAVRHIEWRDVNGNIIFTSDCADFDTTLRRTVFLPKTCTIREYAEGQKDPETTTTFQVKKLGFGKINKSFTLSDHQPGTYLILHKPTDHELTSIVQQDGSLKPTNDSPSLPNSKQH